ncbi:hypothetical protein [Cryobacterium sp. Y11]|uniref:hypothetical protein n=1 Tax=Cryobacterium sp. Y11 TaxID=2045016 RepID=UPI000CE31878|nr:hypothetical protein [Cryobacterium sp. Y11]
MDAGAVAPDFTLARYLEFPDVVKIEAERFPPLSVVLRESFGSPDHELMVMAHDIRVSRFNTRDRDRSIAGDANGDQRLAAATAEWLAFNDRKRAIESGRA